MIVNILGWIILLLPIVYIGYLIFVELKMRKLHRQDCDHSTGKQKELNNALFQAVEIGDVEKVKRAIVDGADVNVRGFGGKTPLIRIAHRAMDEKHCHDQANMAMVRTLVEKGADVNLKDSFDHSAIEYCDWYIPPGTAPQIIEFLIKNGAKGFPLNSRYIDGG
ncbi:MAG: hypothetical protein AAB575_01915 [Patescibacteria group bacterium]